MIWVCGRRVLDIDGRHYAISGEVRGKECKMRGTDAKCETFIWSGALRKQIHYVLPPNQTFFSLRTARAQPKSQQLSLRLSARSPRGR